MLNKTELEYRIPYFLLLLITSLFVFINTHYTQPILLYLSVIVITARLVSKKYFVIKKPWKIYLILSLVLAFYIKINSETLLEREQQFLFTFVYYCFFCACLLLLRDPSKYSTNYFVVFAFSILVFSSTIFVYPPIHFGLEVLAMSSITIYMALKNHKNQLRNFLAQRIFWFSFSLISLFLFIKVFEIYHTKLESYLNRFSHYKNPTFRNTLTLNTLESIWNDPKQKNSVVLRAFSQNPPLHLKTTNYNFFSNNEWTNTQQNVEQQLDSIEYDSKFYTRLMPSSWPDTTKPDCQIVLSLFLRGQLYYTNHTAWIETKSPLFKLENNGTLPTNTGRSGYSLFYTNTLKEDPQEASQNLFNNILLSDDDREYLVNLAHTIVQENDSIQTKVNKIHDYLKKNHEYDLFPKIPESDNKIIYFLKNKTNAHCQYFSSAATFLLRASGVSCRVVTGFLCFRYNEFGKYWIARALDAHAWVEYYDNSWVTFDPTEGSRITEETQEILASMDGMYDYFDYKLTLLAYQLMSGEMKRNIEYYWDKLVDFLLNYVYIIYTLTILALIILIVYYKFFRKKQHRASAYLHYDLPPESCKKITKDFLKLLRLLERKNIILNNSDTLDTLLQKIQDSAFSPQQKDQYTQLITQYQQIRFQAPL